MQVETIQIHMLEKEQDTLYIAGAKWIDLKGKVRRRKIKSFWD